MVATFDPGRTYRHRSGSPAFVWLQGSPYGWFDPDDYDDVGWIEHAEAGADDNERWANPPTQLDGEWFKQHGHLVMHVPVVDGDGTAVEYEVIIEGEWS